MLYRRVFVVTLLITIALGIVHAMAASIPLLPAGNRIEVKYRNFETFPPLIVGLGQANGTEDNWGIIRVTTITDLDAPGQPIIFAEDVGLTQGQITGIFWGLDVDDVVPNLFGDFSFTFNAGVGPFSGTPAGVSLWWDDVNAGGTFFTPAGPGARTGDQAYPTVTDGTQLIETRFVPGVLAADPPTVIKGVISGTTLPVNGTGTGFLDVVPGSGVWATQLDTNGFTTALGTQADLDLFNRFDTANESGGTGGPGFGFPLISQDPVVGNVSAIPEPSTVLLLGTGLVSLVGLRGWRRYKASRTLSN